MQPELIADYACECGEGPLWHPTEKRVYWVDIPAGRLLRYTPGTGEHAVCYEAPEAIGGFTIQADGSLLLFLARGAVHVWRDGALTTVVEDIPDERETRFNDVIADPAGRVFCGTMPAKDRPGRLYRLDTDGTATKVLEGVGTSNGMGFTPDRTRMYHTDSHVGTIYCFDCDEATGALSNRRVFFTRPREQGCPDGMTVDAEGYVWTAIWDGGCALRLAPDGTEDRRIAFPAKKVSCVTFGGEDYTDLYVTTAGGNAKETDGDAAGALFRIVPGVRGVPEFPSRVGLT